MFNCLHHSQVESVDTQPKDKLKRELTILAVSDTHGVYQKHWLDYTGDIYIHAGRIFVIQATLLIMGKRAILTTSLIISTLLSLNTRLLFLEITKSYQIMEILNRNLKKPIMINMIAKYYLYNYISTLNNKLSDK